MSNPDDRSVKAALRDLAAAMESDLSAHPAPEALLDFLAGDLPEDEREGIEEHLAICRSCARTALDFSMLPESEREEGEGEPLSERELASEWERFRATVAPPVRPPRHTAPLLALAAALLIAVAGLSLWSLHLGRQVRALSGPRADVAVVDLVPLDAVERTPREGEPARLPSWAERLVLILNLAEPAEHSRYQVEIAGPDGRAVWSRPDVRRGEDGTFTLELPRRFLPPGSYHIRVSGLRDGTAEPVAEYAIRIGPV